MHLRCRLTKNSPRRIRSGTDAAGSKLQQVFRQKNLSLDSVHGRTLSNMPAGVIHSAPCIRYHYFQKRWLCPKNPLYFQGWF